MRANERRIKWGRHGVLTPSDFGPDDECRSVRRGTLRRYERPKGVILPSDIEAIEAEVWSRPLPRPANPVEVDSVVNSTVGGNDNM